MNRLEQLRAKSKTYDIDGVEFKIKSLTFPELADFSELIDNKDNKKALDFLLFSALRKSIETKTKDPINGMSDEEIKLEIESMDGMTAMKLVKAIQEVSGLAEDKVKKLTANEITN